MVQSNQPLLDETEVSKLLHVALATLRNWRSLNRGPGWVRIGARAVRYRADEIERFIEAGAVQTSGHRTARAERGR